MNTLNIGDIIENRDNPQWGEFRVTSKYDEGIWEIESSRGARLLYKDELRFWRLIIKG